MSCCGTIWTVSAQVTGNARPFPRSPRGDIEGKTGEGKGENGRPDLLTGVPSAKTSLDLLFPFMTLPQYEPSF